MSTLHHLSQQLKRIDGRQYGAYKAFQGDWQGDDIDICIDHVQGDPFAAPSVVRVRVHNTHSNTDQHISDFTEGPTRTATCDLLLRVFAEATTELERTGSGHSGQVRVDAGGAEILRRSGCEYVDGVLELRMRVGLPARGRRVLGHAAASLLTNMLPESVRAVRAAIKSRDRLELWQRSALEHAHLSSQLRERGLVAFIADGAVLPRASGVSSQPLKGAIPFEAPASLRATLRDTHGASVTGLGVPTGITVITGAGFHGKSTLLAALAVGVHAHVPGDGRERVVTLSNAVKVRSEDGRSVTGVNLRPFITALPAGKSTASFSTSDASGSTSLAASIQEAIEGGADTLLLDEDTCATNLLVRDARMQALTKVDAIVPLVDRVIQLQEELDVSIIAVIGGCGDYLDVATTTIAMREYRAFDVSDEARRVVDAMPSGRAATTRLDAWPRRKRVVKAGSLAAVGRKGGGKARGLRDLIYGSEELALDGLEQLVDESQVRFIAVLLEWMSRQNRQASLCELAEKAVEWESKFGLYSMRQSPELAGVRALDLISVVNRLRTLRLA